jgi:lipid-binding SYLF domain-containing protein
MKAEILSWSRTQGLFAGVSLEGSTMRTDDGANKNIYGKEVSGKDIVFKHEVTAPPSASLLLSELNKIAPHRQQ